MKIEEIIEFENENTSLDFKRDQYKKEKFGELLKDVISMANAETKNEKIIITGVKHKPSGEREFVGIPVSDIIDEANFQNLIRDNIEPDIEISYTYTEFKNLKFGVLRLLDDSQKPYMMKKDFQPLKKGDCFIRKGSNQQRAVRADFEKIYNARKRHHTEDQVSIFFSGNEKSTQKDIFLATDFELPSQEAKKEIEEILAKRQSQKETPYLHANRAVLLAAVANYQSSGLRRFSPYDERSTETLKENLEKINETYKEDDEYTFSEILSDKINIEILNNGTEYITDAKIQIEIEHKNLIYVADSILSEPSHSFIPTIPNFENITEYPKVLRRDGIIIISEEIGDIRHKVKTQVFKKDLRVNCLTSESVTIELKTTLFAKNLPEPISRILHIRANPQK